MEQQTVAANKNKKENTFNVYKLVGRFLDYWYLYLISLIVCIGIAYFKVHYATPMYRVYAQVLIQDDKSGSSQGLSGSSGGMDFSMLFNGKSNVYNELAILQTQDLFLRVVNEMKLNVTYYHKGQIRSVELYKTSPFEVAYRPDNDSVAPIGFEIKFSKNSLANNNFTIIAGNKSIQWRFNDSLHLFNVNYYFTRTGNSIDPDASYILSIARPENVAGEIASNLSSDLMGIRATVINLSYNTSVPEKGKDILAGIIKAYTERNLNEKNRISDSTIDFINKRIVLVGGELSGIETDIQQFKQKNKIANLSAQSEALVTNSSGYYDKLKQNEVQLQVVQTMVSYLQNEQNNGRPVPALLSTDPTFLGLVDKYNTLQIQKDRMLLSVKESNPIVANLNTQIANLRNDMIKSLRSQQDALNISEQQLKSQNSRINSLISNVPEQERRYIDFSREQEVKQALYLFLLQKKEEASISRSANVSNAQIIESPKANYKPYSPDKTTGLMTGIILGLILPTSFIMLKQVLNTKIVEKEDVTNATEVTVLSEIGHSKHAGLINITEDGRSVIAEQFRVFRTNLDFVTGQQKCPVLLFTSSISGEGKSFIVANLGQIYAVSGKKVLLMELDLRKPKLSSTLSVNNEMGFSNFIISGRPIGDFIKPIVNDGVTMYILPSGPIPPNPAELLMSGRMSTLINELKQNFDIILIDTAPIGVVVDAQILGNYVDTTLYIIRQRFSYKNSLGIVNDIVSQNKLPSLYVIINDIKAGSSYKYGYNYGYRYSYGYAYSNGRDKPKSFFKRRKQGV